MLKDRRVTIQVASVTETAMGEPVTTWADVRTESASYHAGSGAERRIAAQEASNLAATFVFHASTLTKLMRPQTHRLNFDGSYWDIESVAAPDRGRNISVTARRRLS